MSEHPHFSSSAPLPRALRRLTTSFLVLLVLVVGALVASVAVPARESWRIIQVLREDRQTVQPARHLADSLEANVAEESSLLARFLIVADTAALRRYEAFAASDAVSTAQLLQLTRQVDSTVSRQASEVPALTASWRGVNRQLVARPGAARLPALMAREASARAALVGMLAKVEDHLTATTRQERETIVGHEQLSLVSNTALVALALAVIGVAIVLTRRELRLSAHVGALAKERSRLLAESRETSRRMASMIEGRSRLMRGFSHDVKNPLGAADGYAELLMQGIYGPLTDEQQHSLARVRASIHRAISLIDDVHEIARLETGHITFRSEAVDLGGLLQLVAEEYHAAATAKRLSLDVELRGEVPEIRSDGGRLRQIIGNLVSNAIKYTDAGGVTLRACPDASGAAAAIAEIVDTGPGIPASKRDVIFEEFSRLDAGAHEGAGLGLAISKRLAEALNCRIVVQDNPSGGALFSVWIPAQASNSPPLAPVDRTPA